MGTAGEGGVGCVAAPSNGRPPLLPSFPRVTLGRGLETPLPPAPLPDPGSTFQALRGSGLPKACRALANFSPGHAGSWARTLATSIGLLLDFFQLEGAAGGVVRPPCALPAQVARGPRSLP